MTHEKRVGIIGVLFLLLALVLGVVMVSAEPVGVSIGEVCFRTLPFDDVLHMDVVQFEVAPGVPAFFTFAVHWIGESPIGSGNVVYELSGNGTAGYNPGDATHPATFTIDLTAWNQTTFFGGNPACKKRAATDGTLTGHWATDCLGKFPPSQGGTPYYAQGTLVPFPCTAPEPLWVTTYSSGMLMGGEGKP